jgi:hypothetical protein
MEIKTAIKGGLAALERLIKFIGKNEHAIRCLSKYVWTITFGEDDD